MADGTGGVPLPDHGRPPSQGGAADTGRGPASLPDMAADWITIWQSELAAMATDRELQEGFLRLVDLWAQTAQTMARLLPRPSGGPGCPDSHDGEGRRAGTAAPAGAPAAMVAPDARDAALERLAARVDELERQLGAQGGGRPAGVAGDGRGG